MKKTLQLIIINILYAMERLFYRDLCFSYKLHIDYTVKCRGIITPL